MDDVCIGCCAKSIAENVRGFDYPKGVLPQNGLKIIQIKSDEKE